MSEVISSFVNSYSIIAQNGIKAGARPALLPCEADGIPCSVKFSSRLAEAGTLDAVANMIDRCPRGAFQVGKALAYSAGIVILGSLAHTGYRPGNDPCDSACDVPLGCGV